MKGFEAWLEPFRIGQGRTWAWPLESHRFGKFLSCSSRTHWCPPPETKRFITIELLIGACFRDRLLGVSFYSCPSWSFQNHPENFFTGRPKSRFHEEVGLFVKVVLPLWVNLSSQNWCMRPCRLAVSDVLSSTSHFCRLGWTSKETPSKSGIFEIVMISWPTFLQTVFQ